MRRLVSDRKRVGAWVAERVGRSLPWTDDAVLGLEREGELIAGIVIDGYVPGARASMHCAAEGKHWLDRTFLHACFDYAFNQLGLQALVNPVAASNTASLRFTRHIGFKEIARVPRAWDGQDDLVLFAMSRDDCRWIGADR